MGGWDRESLLIRACFRKANYEGQRVFAAAIERIYEEVSISPLFA